MKPLFGLLLVTLLGSNILAAEKIDTKEYFPMDKPHGYTVFDGASMQYIEYQGKSMIENRPIYIISKTIITASQPGVKKDVFSYNNDGDICYLGYILNDTGKVKWEKKPSIRLKGKMEIGKPYLIEVLDGVNGNVSLTLKGFRDVKLKKIYPRCLVVEKYTSFNKKVAPQSMDLKDIYYYAKNIGVIKSQSIVYRLKNGKLSQDGPAMSQWIVK